MCDSKGNGFNFVFEELSRKVKPCLNLKNQDDAKLLAKALTFAKDHCIKIDGCCSSRIYANLSNLSNLVAKDDKDLGSVGQALKYGLVYQVDEKEAYCCEDRTPDSEKGDLFSW